MQLDKQHEAHESLPESLEHLMLEYWQDSVYSDKTDALAVQNGMQRFWSIIEKLATNTNRRLPALKDIAIGQLYFEPDEFWADDSCVKAREMLERAGVQLCSYFPSAIRGFG